MKFIFGALRLFPLLTWSTFAVAKELNAAVGFNSQTLNGIGSNNERSLASQVFKQRGGLLQPQEDTISVIDPNCTQLKSFSLSADGDVVSIGYALYNANSPCYYNPGGVVEVYKYDKDLNKWNLRGKTIFDKGSLTSLSADGNILVAGKHGVRGGSVYVFQYNDVAQDWESMGAFMDLKENLLYGKSVAISDDGQILAIGHPGDVYLEDWEKNPDARGSVHIYRHERDATWTRVGAKIEGRVDGEGLGNLVSLSGDGSIVAIGMTSLPSEGGHLEVYQLNEQEKWSQMGTNIINYVESVIGYPIQFGLSTNGRYIAVNYVFRKSAFTSYNASVVYKYSSSDGEWYKLTRDTTWLVEALGSVLSIDDIDDNGKMHKVVFKHQGLDFASSTNGKTVVADIDYTDITGGSPSDRRVKVLDYFVDNDVPNPPSPSANPISSPTIAEPPSKGKGKGSKSKKSPSLKSKKKAPKEPKSHKHYSYSKKSGKKSAKSVKAAK